MSIHFSMGGPVVSLTVPPLVCPTFVYSVEYNMTAVWKDGCMTDDSIIANNVIGIPRGDYIRVVVGVVDSNGSAVDISGFTNIEYVIAESIKGFPVIYKTLGDGIAIGGDNASFVITLSETDTAGIPRDYSYHECRLTNGVEGRTLFAGPLRSPETILGID